MAHSLLPLALVVLLAAPAAAQTGPPPARRPAAQSVDVRDGIGHFDKAFYQLTPRNRLQEAAGEFDQAIAAFERELSVNASSTDAHRYLGRIYAVRKEFRKAAGHYDRVAALEPLNVDACVLAALAYVEAGDADEARRRLEEAWDRTLDPGVLARLDEYLAKVDALKR